MLSKTETHPSRCVGIDQLKRGRWQPRQQFDDAKLQELATSIDEVGVIEPLIVRFDIRDGKYEIIAGERRWRAAQIAFLHQLPVIVRNDLDDVAAQSMALIENLQREDLDPIEEAGGIFHFIDQLGITHKEAGLRIGKSRSYITNAIRLLDLPEKIKDYLRSGQLEPGHAKHIQTLPTQIQLNLAHMAVRLGWSVRQIGARAAEMKVLTADEVVLQEHRDPNLTRLENIISNTYAMPTKLEFDEKNRKGKVVINWHSLDELQGLLQAWGVDQE